jgi:hypothetical protein
MYRAHQKLISDVLTRVIGEITVICSVKLCSLVDSYQHFAEPIASILKADVLGLGKMFQI